MKDPVEIEILLEERDLAALTDLAEGLHVTLDEVINRALVNYLKIYEGGAEQC